jgi:hypothetical protein
MRRRPETAVSQAQRNMRRTSGKGRGRTWPGPMPRTDHELHFSLRPLWHYINHSASDTKHIR